MKRRKLSDKMTDRERILMNIAGMLAFDLHMLQLRPEVKADMERRPENHPIRVRPATGFSWSPEIKKGDLVVCYTSCGIKQNPWIVSFVHERSGDITTLRSIGTNDLCKYSNETFLIVEGMPGRLMLEGGQRIFQQKLAKATAKMDTFVHRFRGVEFPSNGVAEVWFGEMLGGKPDKPTKPYAIMVKYDKTTTIKNIIQQLIDGGFGTREFEPANDPPTKAG